jgi:hypothetical protein
MVLEPFVRARQRAEGPVNVIDSKRSDAFQALLQVKRQVFAKTNGYLYLFIEM